MKVMINNEECIVKWQHNSKKHFSTRLHKEIAGETECTIRCPKINLNGKAFCLMDDQYNKNIGRKRSMAKALEVLDKSVRKTFWDAYQVEIGI